MAYAKVSLLNATQTKELRRHQETEFLHGTDLYAFTAFSRSAHLLRL